MLRINLRYLTEVVEAFDVCPFARGARESGALGRRVILGEPIVGGLAAIEELERDPKIDVAIVIFPRFAAGVDAFEELTSELRRRDSERRNGRAPFALAPFHPEPRFADDTPAKLVMFFRRAPDPCIQLVRFSALDQAKSRAPAGKFLFDWSPEAQRELDRRAQTLPLSERIARDNFETYARAGREKFETVFGEIRADRERTYARFA